MDPKTTDWRAGPNVCRCCLAEGCYKDISTEYFWMGKREVYAEMLSETLNLSIAYSNSGGPNSNSRLICELCISRLRDASDFKRQVQECERTFLRHLDPGSSSMAGDVEVTLEPTEVDPDVKLERVKQEKPVSDDDGDEFDERCGFDDDDDDDDLDDQPLTRLASRIPKKESVDLLDLLDNTKATEKRKSSSKAKSVPTKKAKTIKKDVKATSSKTPVKTEKKKKESSQAVVETQTASHLRIDDVSGCREEDSAIASTTEAPPSAVTPDDATDDEDVIEGTPPRPILIRRRARAVSPQSHALGRANESPLEKMMKIISNPPSVAQEVELGGTPSSTITMKTGSGTSGVSYNFDIGVDLEAVEETEEEALAGTERAYPDDSVAFIVNVPVADKNYMLVDCPANVAIDAPAHQGEDVTVGDSANAGSDIEPDDDEPHGPLRRRDVHEYDEVEGNPFLEDQVQVMNAADDAFLRTAPDNAELLHFDWSSEVDNFEGVREIFSGPSGPTFDLEGLTPLDVFRQIWDTNILSLMVRETNRYAQHIIDGLPTSSSSRMNRWVDTDEEEMWRFLCILMLQSLVYTPVEREYWYPIQESVKLGCDDIMPYNRFILLKRCLHFVDNTTLDPVSTSKLQKVMPIIQHLNHKFGSLYLPEQNVAIDESLLLWKGRLSFAQLIATKRARVGIKSYELCESRTGYLWKMEIYTGSGHIHEPQEATQAAAGHDVENEPESATSQIVFSLMRPLFGKGHTLVMDNFYNSPLLSRILKLKYKTDTVGTLRLKREYVPESLKGKTKQNMRTGEICFSSTKDLCIVVWMDSNVVSMISTCHGVKSGGKEKYGYYKYKPEVVLYYNNTMGGIDHKDQMLSSYSIERVRNVIWYKKLFRRLLNVSVHNSFVIYTHGNEMKYRHFRNTIVTQLRAAYQHPAPSRALVVRPSGQRAAMHLPQKIKKLRCKLCYAAKKTRNTVWQCSTCLVALCLPDCYKEYHDKLCTE